MVSVPQLNLPSVRVSRADILLNRSLNSVTGAFLLLQMNKCPVERCIREIYAGGFCEPHYRRFITAKRLNKTYSEIQEILDRPIGKKRTPNLPISKSDITSNCKINPETQCWEWQRTRNNESTHPYGRIYLPGRIWEYAHRAAYRLWIGEIPKGKWVLHKCDNAPCCNPDHLFLGTASDNSRDSVQKGRARQVAKFKTGEDHPNSKLTNESVALIRSSRLSNIELAKILSVTRHTVGNVRRGATWKL